MYIANYHTSINFRMNYLSSNTESDVKQPKLELIDFAFVDLILKLKHYAKSDVRIIITS